MDYKKDVAPDNGGEENQDDDKKGDNHGNLGLPFGLCAKYGIPLPDGATPRDAWNALKQRKGIDPPWEDENGEDKARSDKKTDKKDDDKAEGAKTQISDEITNYSSDIKTTKATTEEQKKSVATAIGTVNSKVPIEKLNSIDLTSRGRNFLASACGGGLIVTTNLLKSVEANPNYQYEHSVEEYKKVAQAKKNRYLQLASEAETPGAKEIFTRYAEEAVKFGRWSVEYENDGLTTSIYHELGHVVADQYFGMINGSRFLVDGKAKIPPERGRQIIRQTYGACLRNGEIYKVSKYGAENEHEFFAETFAMYIAGKEELPETIAKMFKELKL